METPKSGDEKVVPLPGSHGSLRNGGPHGVHQGALCIQLFSVYYLAIATTSLVNTVIWFSPDCPVHF